MSIAEFLAGLTDPDHVLTHIPYALLVLSMMMNDMGWLRAIAILAGVIRIINRAFFDIDPIIVVWETVFVAVNVMQLLILWYYARRHRFSAEEQRFVDILPGNVSRRTVRKLLRLSTPRSVEAGVVLTSEGQAVERLIFIGDGVAQIERAGRIIAVCGPGDFVGEMSFVTGAPASATAVAARPMALFEFDQKRLQSVAEADIDLRRALEAAFNRNLVGKLGRAPLAG